MDRAPAKQQIQPPRSAPLLGAEVVFGNDVGYAEAAAGFEDAEGLSEHGGLVGGQVDDAVGDDHVDTAVGQRDGFDLAFEELHIGHPSLGSVAAGQVEHLAGHVQFVRLAVGADPAAGQQNVDATAGSVMGR